MFAGGETIRINVLPSRLFDFVGAKESAEGAKITDEEVCALRAVVDGYQNGKLYVPDHAADDREMNAIRQINAAIVGRKSTCVNTYEARSYDLNTNRNRLTAGTITLTTGGLLAVGVIVFPLSAAAMTVALSGSVTGIVFGGFATISSNSQILSRPFPSTISKPVNNSNDGPYFSIF